MHYLYLISRIIKKLQLPSLKNTKVHKTSKVCSGSHVVNSTIDKYSYIGNYSTVLNTDIGSFCSIADNCVIGGSSHPLDWVSVSPVFYNGKNIMKKNFSTHYFNNSDKTVIGNDVWIGSNCLIKGGVIIEDGAVIGMGSVLTKNVGKFEVWAGNPAKLIYKRYADEIIEKIVDTKWWEWSDETISRNSSLFNDVNSFIKFHKRGE